MAGPHVLCLFNQPLHQPFIRTKAYPRQFGAPCAAPQPVPFRSFDTGAHRSHSDNIGQYRTISDNIGQAIVTDPMANWDYG